MGSLVLQGDWRFRFGVVTNWLRGNYNRKKGASGERGVCLVGVGKKGERDGGVQAFGGDS